MALDEKIRKNSLIEMRVKFEYLSCCQCFVNEKKGRCSKTQSILVDLIPEVHLCTFPIG